MHAGGSYLSVHEQSQGEGHSQAPLSEILLTVHSDVGVARRETHERGSFAGHAAEGRPAIVSGSLGIFTAALRDQRETGAESTGSNLYSHLPERFQPEGRKRMK